MLSPSIRNILYLILIRTQKNIKITLSKNNVFNDEYLQNADIHEIISLF
jgi:hypothetical protein